MSGRDQLIQSSLKIIKLQVFIMFHVSCPWRQTNTQHSCLLRRRHWNLFFCGYSLFHGTLPWACKFRRRLGYLRLLLVSYFWLRWISLGTVLFGCWRFCCRSQKLPISSEDLIAWYDYIWPVWKFLNTGSFLPGLVLAQGLNSDFLTNLQFR